MRRYFSLANLTDIFKIPIGFIQCLWYVFWFMPDLIFSKGGYGSIPIIIVGWIYRIPIIIHESDSVPGLANKTASKFAKKIIISFKNAKKYFPDKKTILMGNPVRKELLKGIKQQGIEMFKLNPEKSTILVIGGSQGAQKINQIILNTLPRLLEKSQIIHICGNKNFKTIKQDSEKILDKSQVLKKQLYHVYPFLEHYKLKHAYAASNLIISRAGAGSIFEISAIGKPSILIPLSSSAANHQNENAQVLTRLNAAIMLKENNLTMNMFLTTVFNLIENNQKAEQMGKNAKKFYDPDTNEKIADQILSIKK